MKTLTQTIAITAALIGTTVLAIASMLELPYIMVAANL
jgi:hypothetical protein